MSDNKTAKIELIEEGEDDEVYSNDDILSLLSPESRAAMLQFQQQQRSGLDEDFRKSQFWYSSNFSALMAKEAISLGGKRREDSIPVTIACLACPSIYQAIAESSAVNVIAYLFEFDQRFAVYSPFFISYDFNHPTDVPTSLHHKADFIILDPPYINMDCFNQTMQTAQLLAKVDSSTRMIANTGSVLADKIERIYNMRTVQTQPTHRVNIMNPFSCYTNYNAVQLGGWTATDEPQKQQQQQDSVT